METKNNTGLIITIIVLVLIIVGLGGYFVYDKILKDNEVVDNSNNNNISNDNQNNNKYEPNYQINELAENKMPQIDLLKNGKFSLDWDMQDAVCTLISTDKSIKKDFDEIQGCPAILSAGNDKYTIVLLNFDETYLVTVDSNGNEISRKTVPGFLVPNYSLITENISFYTEEKSGSNLIVEQKEKLYKYDLNSNEKTNYDVYSVLKADERIYTNSVFKYNNYFVVFALIPKVNSEKSISSTIEYIILDNNGNILFRNNIKEIPDIQDIVFQNNSFYIKDRGNNYNQPVKVWQLSLTD